MAPGQERKAGRAAGLSSSALRQKAPHLAPWSVSAIGWPIHAVYSDYWVRRRQSCCKPLRFHPGQLVRRDARTCRYADVRAAIPLSSTTATCTPVTRFVYRNTGWAISGPEYPHDGDGIRPAGPFRDGQAEFAYAVPRNSVASICSSATANAEAPLQPDRKRRHRPQRPMPGYFLFYSHVSNAWTSCAPCSGSSALGNRDHASVPPND